MFKKKKIVAIGLLIICLTQLRAEGQEILLESDTLSYKQAIEGILRLDTDLKACETNLLHEKNIVVILKQRAESCEVATKTVKRKVFWGKVWLGLKAGIVGVGIGVVLMEI